MFCAQTEREEHRTSERFQEYPRWSTVTSMVLHWGVHFFAAVVLTIRLHASFASDVNNSMQVTVIEIHVAAAAMAIVLRDFVSFQMDWMFWAHHAVVVTMTMSLYLFVAPPQWLICCFVGAVMEAGSGGYDVFIVASHAYVPLAGYIYGAIMSTSHVVVMERSDPWHGEDSSADPLAQAVGS